MFGKLGESDEYCRDWEHDDAKEFFLRLGPGSITAPADFLDESPQDDHARWTIAGVLARWPGHADTDLKWWLSWRGN